MKEIIYLTDYEQKSFEKKNFSGARDFFYGLDLLDENFNIRI